MFSARDESNLGGQGCFWSYVQPRHMTIQSRMFSLVVCSVSSVQSHRMFSLVCSVASYFQSRMFSLVCSFSSYIQSRRVFSLICSVSSYVQFRRMFSLVVCSVSFTVVSAFAAVIDLVQRALLEQMTSFPVANLLFTTKTA